MNKGFSVLVVLLIIPVIFAVLFFAIKDYLSPEGDVQKKVSSTVVCPQPFTFTSPVDVGLVSGILYPGQIRGNDYKAHGGFRFDDLNSNNVEVRAIFDGVLVKASKYEDDWGLQYLLFYQNECGLMVMHDHLAEVSPKLQKVFDEISVGKNGDSRTTDLSHQNIKVEKGEILATKIGYENFPGGANNKNIFIDFGLYDMSKANGVEYSDEFAAQNPNIDSYGRNALCWLDLLKEPEKSIVNSLKAGGAEGKVSDYCS